MGTLISTLETLNECPVSQEQLETLRTLYDAKADEWNTSLEQIGIKIEAVHGSGKRKQHRHRFQIKEKIEQQRLQQWSKDPGTFWTDNQLQCPLDWCNLATLYAYSQEVDGKAFEGIVRQRFIMMIFRDLLDIFAPSDSHTLQTGHRSCISQPRIDKLADLIIQDGANTAASDCVRNNLRSWIKVGSRWHAITKRRGNGIVFVLSARTGQWVQNQMRLEESSLELDIENCPRATEELNNLGRDVQRHLLDPFYDKHRFQSSDLTTRKRPLSLEQVTANSPKRARIEQEIDDDPSGNNNHIITNSSPVLDAPIEVTSASPLSGDAPPMGSNTVPCPSHTASMPLQESYITANRRGLSNTNEASSNIDVYQISQDWTNLSNPFPAEDYAIFGGRYIVTNDWLTLAPAR